MISKKVNSFCIFCIIFLVNTKNIRIVDLIFIDILTTFWPICSSAFFRCFMSNSGVLKESRTEPFFWATGIDCCYILTLDRAVNQEMHLFKKNSRSRCTLENNITRCPGGSSQLEKGCQSENQLQTEGFGPLVTPRWATQAKMRKKCCYGREKNLDQYSSPSLSPLISHTQQTSPLRK